MTTGADVVAEALTWLGTRWQHQQRTKGLATDCIGMVGGVGVALGIPEAAQWANDQSLKGYGREPDPEVLLAACDKYLDRVPSGQFALGDVIVMKMRPQGKPQHFAIVSRLDPPYIVHAYLSARKVAENIVDDLWRSRILFVYRFRGLQ